jgi:hypothetical protein
VDDSQQYYKDSTTRIIQLLQTTLGTEIKTYYKGTPLAPPAEEDYPVLVVQKMTGATQVGSTTTDDAIEEIMISIVNNRLEDIGGSDIIDTTMQKLHDLVEAKDPTQPVNMPVYMPKTVMGALRSNLTLGTSVIDGDISWQYGNTPVPGHTGFAEVDIKLRITERVFILNRS